MHSKNDFLSRITHQKHPAFKTAKMKKNGRKFFLLQVKKRQTVARWAIWNGKRILT
jgi:hypothetical protein